MEFQRVARMVLYVLQASCFVLNMAAQEMVHPTQV